MSSKRFYGERLRASRERSGMSQAELASTIGAAQSQITRYETNLAQPSQDVLIRMATTLNVSTDYLLGLTESMTGHITEAELTDYEVRVITAMRRGDFKELIGILAQGDD
jgi:transcriptional regulator with XRE-family HTH domain